MKIQFEASTSCNSNCKFCPRGIMKREKGEMSDELFHKIIKESKAFRNPEIVPFLNGEPFIFPRIWKWLDYMKEQDCRVYLYTNAEFMDVERVITYPNIRYICCSINAASDKTHKKIMRGPNYYKVLANVEELIKRAPFKVYVSMVKTQDNSGEVQAFKDKWGNKAIFGEFKNWGGVMHDSIEKSGERKNACVSLLRAITILHDGRAALCCMDYEGKLIIGDANKQTLSELLIEYKKMWKKHYALDFDYEPCRNCNQNI